MRALIIFGAVALTVSVSSAFVACSSSSTDPQPPNNTFKTDSGNPTTDTSTTDSGNADGDETSAPVDTGPPDAACFDDGGCFKCKPATDDQFLNRCTSSACSPFDDKTRIPSSTWDGGKLPPVP
jgi:hypothetical protein